MEDEGNVERLGFQAKMAEVMSPPPGFDSQEPTNTHPPGFEFTANSEPHQRNPELNKQPVSTNRRITRSQARKNVLAVKERPQKTKSSETSESLVKLAKESLEIGKILGVKVIIHEQAALRKITASLEENKRKHSGGRS
uniref:Uncharacterized protein n=2 Tax=Opuntia streptacantha TaxID=393608 RepID=A0A7C9CYB1_OPUST